MINISDLWVREWNNSYAFYNSKGNTNTKSRLKNKWYKDFKAMLKLVETEVIKDTKAKMEDL